MKTQKLNLTICDTGFAIYERKVRMMAVEYSIGLVRVTFLRVADPRSGGGAHPIAFQCDQIRLNSEAHG